MGNRHVDTEVMEDSKVTEVNEVTEDVRSSVYMYPGICCLYTVCF